MTRAVKPGQRAVVLALGSNLGDRMAHLQQGIDLLDGDGITAAAVSGVFETAPVGGPAQDDYLNAVLLTCSALPAGEILIRCAGAETIAGRVRGVRWGPRTLDVDIITCDEELSADPALTLPHPRAHERAFVLAPWLDVQPAAVLPGWGPVADLLARISTAGVRRRADLRLVLPDAGGRGVKTSAVRAEAPCA
jgi:2-amino-4-hydroxy-6-hydroxymethyldihydropteridine diphosphokinase